MVEEVVQKYGLGSEHCRLEWSSAELAEKLSVGSQARALGITFNDHSAWSDEVDRRVAEYELREGAQVAAAPATGGVAFRGRVAC